MINESLSSESWESPNLKVLVATFSLPHPIHYTAPNIGWHNFKEFLLHPSLWTAIHQWVGVPNYK